MVKPSAVPTAKLTTMIREGRTWSDVENAAEAMLDKNKVKNTKAKVVKSIHVYGHNFDAFVEIKKKNRREGQVFNLEDKQPSLQ